MSEESGPGPLPTGSSRGVLLAVVATGLEDLPEGAGAVVAVSGGPDSTALAYLVAEARADLHLTLVHVSHGLRDDAEDRAMVAQHADWLGLPLVVREVDVAPAGEGTQAAARRERYRALREVAAERDAIAVLVGHTAEDQAETLLLRLARGTGVGGLAGMRTRSGDLVRPLLRLRRADVRRFLLLEGLPSVDDPSNLDRSSRRVVARHDALGALEAVGPDPAAALARLADLAHDDAAALDDWASRVGEAIRRVGPVVAVAHPELTGLPPAVSHRVLRHLVVEVTGRPPPSAAAVRRLARLRPGAALDLPGGARATAAGGWTAVSPTSLPEQAPTPLSPGGWVGWLPAGVAIAWHTPAPDPEVPAGRDGATAQIALDLPGCWRPPAVEVDAALVPPGGRVERATLAVPEGAAGLVVRHRRPGDRLALPVGHRRLKDVLVDAGVPRAVRAVWPVLVDAEGRLLWVPGVAADRDVVREGRSRPVGLLALAALHEAEGAQ